MCERWFCLTIKHDFSPIYTQYSSDSFLRILSMKKMVFLRILSMKKMVFLRILSMKLTNSCAYSV